MESPVRAVALLGALVLSSAVLVASATPAMAAPTVTVDPSTALADGQPITVTITGLEPNFPVDTAQCTAVYVQRHEIFDCEPSFVPQVQADSSGRAVVHLRAKRFISTFNGIVDCLSVADPCVIAGASAADLGSADTAGAAPITFDAHAPPPAAPDVSATPSDDLTDGQSITVEATGLVTGEQVIVQQCAAGARAGGDCDRSTGYSPATGVADASGAATIDLTVHRVMLVGSDHIDCAEAVGSCVVAAHASGGPFGTAPLGFSDSAPAPPTPSLTIDPASGLADGQLVRVLGSGFTPNSSITIVECRSDATTVHFGCPSTSVRTATADSLGAFSTTTRIVRTLDHADSPIDRPRVTDCGDFAGRCVLWASDLSVDAIDVLNTAIAPLEFDPNAAPIEPSISVSPANELTDGQTVHVVAGGFPPAVDLFVTVCQNVPFPRFSFQPVPCDNGRALRSTSDDQGRIDVDFVVHPSCGPAPDACVVAVMWFGFEIEVASAPVTFVAPPDESTSTTATTSPAAPTRVSDDALARTGTDARGSLGPVSLLFIVGGMAVITAAELRHRARRRRAVR